VSPLPSSCKTQLESSETYQTEASSSWYLKLLKLQASFIKFKGEILLENGHWLSTKANIKMENKEWNYENINWVELIQENVQWCALVVGVLNIWAVLPELV
jgi:hypothetical protein